MKDHGQPRLLDHHLHGHTDVLKVCVPEVFNADIVQGLSHAIRGEINASGAASFVLDLSAVQYMTSVAVGMLINLRAHLSDRGYAFALAGAGGDVAHMISCTRLGDIMPVFPTVDGALAELNDPCHGCNEEKP